MEILRVENLCKTYGKGEAKVNVLKNVSFALLFTGSTSCGFGWFFCMCSRSMVHIFSCGSP